ncbi:MAG TPA: peptidogalycan biosysnthesis protein, partial [Caulobacteraceae bacterium]|nr:peptidogalycan biosysnthesis protein [Caulobacteraceae bacterium]
MASVSVHPAIAEIGRDTWDGVANPFGNPFISFDFLDILEHSGCASPRTGWSPCHLAARDHQNRLVGVMPLYLKTHSQGEYVFDWSWADAYERAGGQYYPKLQCAAPFSPVTGPRLIGPDEAKPSLLAGALELCRRTGASGLHVTFASQEDWRFLGDQGLLQRQDRQFHWRNQGYDSF